MGREDPAVRIASPHNLDGTNRTELVRLIGWLGWAAWIIIYSITLMRL